MRQTLRKAGGCLRRHGRRDDTPTRKGSTGTGRAWRRSGESGIWRLRVPSSHYRLEAWVVQRESEQAGASLLARWRSLRVAVRARPRAVEGLAQADDFGLGLGRLAGECGDALVEAV